MATEEFKTKVTSKQCVRELMILVHGNERMFTVAPKLEIMQGYYGNPKDQFSGSEVSSNAVVGVIPYGDGKFTLTDAGWRLFSGIRFCKPTCRITIGACWVGKNKDLLQAIADQTRCTVYAWSVYVRSGSGRPKGAEFVDATSGGLFPGNKTLAYLEDSGPDVEIKPNPE